MAAKGVSTRHAKQANHQRMPIFRRLRLPGRDRPAQESEEESYEKGHDQYPIASHPTMPLVHVHFSTVSYGQRDRRNDPAHGSKKERAQKIDRPTQNERLVLYCSEE